MTLTTLPRPSLVISDNLTPASFVTSDDMDAVAHALAYYRCDVRAAALSALPDQPGKAVMIAETLICEGLPEDGDEWPQLVADTVIPDDVLAALVAPNFRAVAALIDSTVRRERTESAEYAAAVVEHHRTIPALRASLDAQLVLAGRATAPHLCEGVVLDSTPVLSLAATDLTAAPTAALAATA